MTQIYRLAIVVCSHGRNLVGDGGDMSVPPTLFQPGGTYHILSPPPHFTPRDIFKPKDVLM